MSINLIQIPKKYEAGFTPFLPFVMSASVSSEPNFKYVLDLYTYPNWTDYDDFTFTTRVSFPPRSNGQGVYSPTKILQSFLEPNYDGSFGVSPFIDLIEDVDDAFVAYKFRYFEQFNPNYFYNEILLPSGGATTSYLTFEPGPTNSNPSSFSNFNVEAGDTITIKKQNPLSQFDLAGTHSVVSVFVDGAGNYTVEIDDNLDIATLNNIREAGYIINVEREDTSINSGTFSLAIDGIGLVDGEGYYGASNMTYQYEEYEQDKIDEYTVGTAAFGTSQSYDGKFLTSYTDKYKPVYLGDYETLDLNFGLTTDNATYSPWYTYYNNVSRRYRLFDENFNQIGSTIVEGWSGDSDKTTPRKFMGSGPANLGITSSNVKYYDIFLTETPNINGLITQRFTYSIIEQCREYEVVRLMFLNKLGGYDYWNFNLVSKYKSNISRTTMQKKLDFDYTMGDRGEKVIGDMIEEEWEINTDWLTDDQAIFIRELVESPDAYLVIQNNNTLNGTLNRSGNYKIPIVLTDSSYNYKSTLNDTQIQYTIKFVKAYKIQNNR